jgi:hypothetical protein
MPANQIQYEVVVAGPDIEAIKKALTDRGRRGYALSHTHVGEDGVYTFILHRDTGMHPEEESPVEWVDDGFVNDETSWTT